MCRKFSFSVPHVVNVLISAPHVVIEFRIISLNFEFILKPILEIRIEIGLSYVKVNGKRKNC